MQNSAKMKNNPKQGQNKSQNDFGKNNKYQPWNRSAQNRGYYAYGTYYDDGSYDD